MARSPKSVRQLLKDKPTLEFLEREIRARGALLNQIRRSLPADLALHCRAAQIREGLLVLHVDSPIWATRLRYLAPELLGLLRPDHNELTSVTVKVLVERESCGPRHKPAKRSAVAASIIHDSAEDTNHLQLRAALERLALAVKK
ncbi:MAG: DUF721 domain-containing protein [Chromatiaceae bacterium]|jgi:hypothetical protein